MGKFTITMSSVATSYELKLTLIAVYRILLPRPRLRKSKRWRDSRCILHPHSTPRRLRWRCTTISVSRTASRNLKCVQTTTKDRQEIAGTTSTTTCSSSCGQRVKRRQQLQSRYPATYLPRRREGRLQDSGLKENSDSTGRIRQRQLWCMDSIMRSGLVKDTCTFGGHNSLDINLWQNWHAKASCNHDTTLCSSITY